VEVSAANPAVADLDFNLLVVTTGFFNLPQFDVTDSRLIFNECFHGRYALPQANSMRYMDW
jgi:hypothetical protein